MKKQGALIFGLALLAVLSAYAFTFTVKYHEVAVRSRFGETNAESIVRDGAEFPASGLRRSCGDVGHTAASGRNATRRNHHGRWFANCRAGLAALEGRRRGRSPTGIPAELRGT